MPTKTGKRNRRTPEVVYRNNKPVSVILDIAEYNEMLERLEDVKDIKFIENLKSKQLKFRKLDDFLTGYNRNV
ncbi:MAG: type II toxin-antitoxin system Phd/YefM family antitoxin [Bacteroidetes bacterium]|nr:type II toxin-antitoxin system Phd/YefM family antitoxin [Bacteroidota bacterium]MCL5031142.1 type II toxin-antitoxin system Phd/YefM family antitoxin [Bacteroidota bacterium]